MVTVRFFASLRDAVGQSEIDVDVRGKSTVEAVFEKLKVQFPQLQRYQPSLLIAVNEQYAQWETLVAEGDEVAFFPPVSGGTAV